jgi:serine/threonine protein phosphatase 1
MSFLNRVFELAVRPRESIRRARLSIDAPLLYAIGDVHGRLDLLTEMEALVANDMRAIDRPATIVLLGDVVDRGPNSAQVIDHILERQIWDGQYYCLAGNHEVAMLEFVRFGQGDAWLQNGGQETLMSYGVPPSQLTTAAKARRAVQACIPAEHLDFLTGLPIAISTGSLFLCHAGAVPGRSLQEQADDHLMWYRDSMRAQYQEYDEIVVHGHDIVAEPIVMPHRVNLDTGAFATGRLSAARFIPGQPPLTFTAERRATK